MSTLTLGLFQRAEHGMGRSFVLSALVHIVLAAILILGVRWQVRAPDTVTVDLVEAPPPPPPAVEAPKPPPKPEPVVKPEPPRVVKPQIAVPEKKVVKKPPPPKPKDDLEFKKRLQEQVAQEQKILDQQRQERELRELLARKEAEAARAAATARAKALNEYIARIQAKVKSNWILPQDLQGNPAAVFDVIQLPTGEVLSIKLVKSSGNSAYDAAVERALLKSSPLPLPEPRELFRRELRLTFHPQDK